MKLKVNSKIFYPGHGPGFIKGTQRIDFAGETKSYYEFEFVNNELTISTPIENVEKLGVRSIYNAQKIKEAIKTLKKKPSKKPPTTNYNELMNIIKKNELSGEIEAFIEIIQYCNHVREERDEDKRLIPTSITKHMKNITYYIIGELALAQNVPYEKASDEFFKITNISTS
jgi:CarD family transcriptional regulator